ncbi:MAG: PRC-barrel domain-containing protein [Hyalangium sp.]|uniref:PRC-barrel domain-containing protein n=1 Tax=Hyalangium sp. TaxID=2028555 RepID=UPI00389AE441
MNQRTNIRRGMAVMSSDGVQMGRVIDVMTDAIIIEKGQFFLRDFRIPIDDISTVQGDALILMRDHTALRKADSEAAAGAGKATVGIAGIAAPPPQGGLGLGPTDLTEARMDSAKFQDHGQYELRPTSEAAPAIEEQRRVRVSTPPGPSVPLAHEPPLAERRAAGPGWDPLSVDEEQEEAPRTSGPDPKAPTRY